MYFLLNKTFQIFAYSNYKRYVFLLTCDNFFCNVLDFISIISYCMTAFWKDVEGEGGEKEEWGGGDLGVGKYFTK